MYRNSFVVKTPISALTGKSRSGDAVLLFHNFVATEFWAGTRASACDLLYDRTATRGGARGKTNLTVLFFDLQDPKHDYRIPKAAFGNLYFCTVQLMHFKIDVFSSYL